MMSKPFPLIHPSVVALFIFLLFSVPVQAGGSPPELRAWVAPQYLNPQEGSVYDQSLIVGLPMNQTLKITATSRAQWVQSVDLHDLDKDQTVAHWEGHAAGGEIGSVFFSTTGDRTPPYPVRITIQWSKDGKRTWNPGKLKVFPSEDPTLVIIGSEDGFDRDYDDVRLSFTLTESAEAAARARKRVTPSEVLPVSQGSLGYLENEKGIQAFQDGDYEQAAKYFKSAVKADSTLAESHYNLGIALDKSGRSWDASTHFLKAYNLAPENSRIAQSRILEEYLLGR
ncbi:MAG: hypothetical protein GWM98_12280 [Nitrospinaceae bacterium]|nr:hypothetical protein [Nitrospinaceae bacterium]NIR55129.1 hypothetical protein [Nitrospinaceae bacterium]NIS85549.1 hypothetical protein [Nitrospinaceae bacterium]NIT82383.1 hypothetical protein [Nitrospinaceae bacterium]NIU44596.1 hypothetical protein [Nitrospinaceae bacterium]